MSSPQENPVPLPAGAPENTGIIAVLFLGALALWTVFMLFGIPALQKRLFLPATREYFYFETKYGVFAIVGYFAFLLLLIIVLTLVFAPIPQGSKGIKGLLLILALMWLIGFAESFLGYDYLSDETIARRSLFSPGESVYSWKDIDSVTVGFRNSGSGKKGSSVRTMRWTLSLKGKHRIAVENAVEGDMLFLKDVRRRLHDTVRFDVKDEDREEWDYARGKMEIE